MVILQLHEQPTLIQKIFAGDIEGVQEELVNSEIDVNAQDSQKRTPLHAAAFKADANIVTALLESGARVNVKDSRWFTPLHRACSVNADKVVTVLLNYNADVNCRDRLYQTPLHVAAANNAYESLELLLDHVIDVDVTDRSGKTALHHAAHNGHIYIVNLLISRGCVVNASDRKYFRPLHCAAQMGHSDAVNLLIRCGADVNACDRNQYTPLHVAAANGNDSACKLLLNAGANVNLQNSFGNTALHISCLNGQQLVCQDLIHSEADPEAVNFRGQTPLHLAAASAHGAECMMYLLSQKVDVNTRSLDGRTALHMTAIHGRFTRSKSLIDQGAVIDCTDKNGCTPLHIAAQNGHDLLANTLMCYGANPSFKGYEGRTPLHMCCLSGFVECCRKFLLAGVDLNVIDNKGKTPVHCAAYKGSVECLDLLVSNGAKFFEKDYMGRLPLHYAASQGHYQCVFTLVGIGSPTNDEDINGCTPLHLASGYDREGKCVEYLLQHLADPFRTNRMGFTPLHYAAAGDNTIAVQILLGLSNCIKFFEEIPPTQITPLHLAAKLGNNDVVQALLDHGANVDVQDVQGITALILAAREGHVHCVQSLVKAGASVIICDKTNNMTAIHHSAKNGHYMCLTEMLRTEGGSDAVTMGDSSQRTPLMLAISFNNIECVKALLDYSVDVEKFVNMVDDGLHSSLFRAVVVGQSEIVQTLLEKNAKSNCIDVNGKSVIHLAAACGYLSCLKLLIKYLKPEEVAVFDTQDCTALHWACYRGRASCVEFLLLENFFKTLMGNPFSPVHCASFSGSFQCLQLLVSYYGKDIIHLQDSRKRFPLHICSIHGHIDAAKFLLEQGADVDVLDEDQRTPFIAAAQLGRNKIIELLLTFNANKAFQDKFGNTALHWACLKENNLTALLLLNDLEDSSLIHIANEEQKTALHIAAKNGLVDVTTELLKRGASVYAVDSDGCTPALSCAPNNQVAQCLALILLNLRNNTRTETDPIQSLSSFLQNASNEETLCSKVSSQTQTCLTLQSNLEALQAAQTFEIPFNPLLSNNPKVLTSHFGLTSTNPFAKSSWRKDYGSGEVVLGSENDCFLIENNDFFGMESTSTAKQNEEEVFMGLNLHRSFSDMSITSHIEQKLNLTGLLRVQHLKELSDRKKECRECKLWQKRCCDCTIRHILRQHLQGKTSPKEFNEFLLKSLNDSSSEYKQKLLKSLEDIGKEFETSCGQEDTPDIRRMVRLNKCKKLPGRKRSSTMVRIPSNRNQIKVDVRDWNLAIRKTSTCKSTSGTPTQNASSQYINLEFPSKSSFASDNYIKELLNTSQRIQRGTGISYIFQNEEPPKFSTNSKMQFEERNLEGGSYKRFCNADSVEEKPKLHPEFVKKLKELMRNKFEDQKDYSKGITEHVENLISNSESSTIYTNACIFTDEVLLNHIKNIIDELHFKDEQDKFFDDLDEEIKKYTSCIEEKEYKEEDVKYKTMTSHLHTPWLMSKTDVKDAWIKAAAVPEETLGGNEIERADDISYKDSEDTLPVEDYILPPKKVANCSSESLDSCLNVIPVKFVTNEEIEGELKISKVYMVEKNTNVINAVESSQYDDTSLDLPFITEKHIENVDLNFPPLSKAKSKLRKEFSCTLC